MTTANYYYYYSQ